MKPLRFTLLAMACLLAPVAYTQDLPSLGDASSGIVSPEFEHALGRAWLSMLRGQVPQISDPLLKEYVERSVYKLAETSQVQDRRLEFILVESPQLNAFAAPGGIIGVNGGLFLQAQTEAEYASVMAHELAHLSQRHFARGLEAQRRMQLPLMGALLAGVVAAAAGAGDAGIAAIASTQAAAIQAQRRFSRQNEEEADRVGMQNLARAGYNPRAMPQMFERLMRQYRFDQRPPEFLLTHPVTESRVADTRGRAEQLSDTGRADSLDYQLMRARTHLLFETTPGMSIKQFRAQLDKNPELAAARYGLALAQMKAGQLQPAREQLDVLLKNPNPIYSLAEIEWLQYANRIPEAKEKVNALLAKSPRYYPAQQSLIDILIKQNNLTEAEHQLDILAAQRSQDPDIWYQVAEIRGLTGNIIGLHRARAEYFALVGDYSQALEQISLAKRLAGNFQMAARLDARYQELLKEQSMVKEMLN